MTELDDLDIRLLKLLQKDATLTTKELANKLNLTPTPIHERVKRLERDGYIKKYVALLDNQKMNKGLVVFCNVTLKQHEKGIGKKFVNDIVSLKEVTECYNVSGQYDFMLKVMVKDMPEYQNFIMNKLASIENIGSTHSVFVMGEIKDSTELPI
ncbi:AsnC family transcriptional regulator [Sporocytophaga myxococcoides]|uniref:AsnC family transcriptional regulator n=1 Tax=Sporocytophaga myxococcoides TaxID=153721 RepID=A0A098LHG7_9BACT|nr:Lrp/AsnC family transcriptional regulator [Sporocytophaga myxococcoides]GAL85598.1 AsnC family transcriptional regulator [Sporocytophaga myxococcoides]